MLSELSMSSSAVAHFVYVSYVQFNHLSSFIIPVCCCVINGSKSNNRETTGYNTETDVPCKLSQTKQWDRRLCRAKIATASTTLTLHFLSNDSATLFSTQIVEFSSVDCKFAQYLTLINAHLCSDLIPVRVSLSILHLMFFCLSAPLHFSERELAFTFAICCRPSVCLSSVCRL